METKKLQNPSNKESSSAPPKKKKRRRRRPKKQAPSTTNGESQIGEIVISTPIILPHCVEPEITKLRRQPFITDLSKVGITLVEKSKYESENTMDKVKRDDAARRQAKQKLQDKSRNLDSSSSAKASANPKVVIGKNQPKLGSAKPSQSETDVQDRSEKSGQDVKPERDLKKQIKLVKKDKPTESAKSEKSTTELPITHNVTIDDTKKGKVQHLSVQTKPGKSDDDDVQGKSEKSREDILAEGELKKQAKLAKAHKSTDGAANGNSVTELPIVHNVAIDDTSKGKNQNLASEKPGKSDGDVQGKGEKSREDVLAERELKKQAKLAKKGKSAENITTEKITAELPITQILENVAISDKPILSKAERREKQEAQRAAKTKLLSEKSQPNQPKPTDRKPESEKTEKQTEKCPLTKKVIPAKSLHKVKLFNHLYANKGPQNIVNSTTIHPAIVQLGAQYANGNIVGSNARCIAFIERIKKVIRDYETPSQKEFGRGLEAIIQPCVNYLNQCRPLCVPITNALRFIKWQITQLPANKTDAELKENLLESADTYVRDQIEKAAQAISNFVQEKISNGDVILTFGCSSLICHIIEEAQKRKVDFSVIVVDARPHHEGREMLRRLVALKIRCTVVLINAIGFIMPEVTKVLLGANAMMANGYVMSRAGTAQVALMAKFYNVPVLVCCETHKFSERVQLDAFVFNEIGDPEDLVLKTGKYTKNEMENWKSIPHLTPLNLRYDLTPPELVTAVVTELAILPCTSVPVILRVKPSEIGY